jgi:hypothetical protein
MTPLLAKLFLAAVSVSVTTEVAGPPEARLTLRRTESTERIPDEKGMEALTELAVSRGGKLLYTLKVEGFDGRPLDDTLYVIARGVEDVEWWSVYRLADGRHLFDSHVPLSRFAPGRYAGFEVPEDGDPRLRDSHLFGIVTIATAAGEVRRFPLRAKDPRLAMRLRSYWDAQRTLRFDAARAVLLLTITGGEPDYRLEIPVRDGDIAQCCDMLAR